MSIEEMEQSLKSICAILLDVKSLLKEMSDSISTIEEEPTLVDLYEEVNNIPLPIPYIGQPKHSLAWIKDLTEEQFEQMLYSLLNYRKTYFELKYEIQKLEKLNEG